MFDSFDRITEKAMQFQRKTDEWGKMFSIVPSVAKLFPEKSDYQPARDLSIYLYTFFKVFFSVNRMITSKKTINVLSSLLEIN